MIDYMEFTQVGIALGVGFVFGFIISTIIGYSKAEADYDDGYEEWKGFVAGRRKAKKEPCKRCVDRACTSTEEEK